jgi:NAD(P)-dependent dehydrogenase (short-subunit alcohol dehydrogenase family)
MTSPHWDENRAEEYRRFRFNFPEKTLAGKTVVVAGGTGGLGPATVSLLASEGAQLVVGYRANRARAEELQTTIEENFKRKILLVPGDLARLETKRNYAAAVEELRTPLAGVVIFAGDPARVTFENLDRDALMTSLETNYVGPVLLARELGETMERSPQGGSIVFLGTMQALSAFPSSLNYAGPKAALVHAAKILAQQWRHVRVNVVAPGATLAGMAAASIQSGKYDAQIETGAIKRFGYPEDVARAVRFFLEPDNYITGQVVVVDGGLSLRRHRG